MTWWNPLATVAEAGIEAVSEYQKAKSDEVIAKVQSKVVKIKAEADLAYAKVDAEIKALGIKTNAIAGEQAQASILDLRVAKSTGSQIVEGRIRTVSSLFVSTYTRLSTT